jgi:signal transduction histidine kinase
MNQAELQRIIRRIILLPLIFAVLLSALLYLQVRWLAHTAQWVDHTDQVIAQATAARVQLLQAQSAIRGYMVSGDRKHLSRFEQSLNDMDKTIDDLRRSISDNPTQVGRLDALRTPIHQWEMVYLKEMTTTQQSQVSLVEEGTLKMNTVTAGFDQFIATEEGLRTERLSRVQMAQTVTTWGTIAFVALASTLAGFVLVREVRRLSSRYQEILDAAESAKNQALAASRVKDDLIATISHELRTPLTSILGWARLLRTPSFPKERMEHALQVIERNTIAEAKLIDELLDAARAAKGKIEIRRQPVELAKVLDAAADWARPVADTLGVRFVYRAHDRGMLLRGDAARLQQVFWNLLSNSLKFTEKGGEVRVDMEQQGEMAVIHVRDNGMGIAPEFLPHIFEPFRQANRKIEHHGLGIGLGIARTIVELHEGTITAQSEGNGKGATFTVTLPLLKARVEKAPVSIPTPEAGYDCEHRLQGLRVMIVEDEPDALEVLKVVLEDCGAHVFTSNSANEALNSIEAEKPDVLISDLRMPGKDGMEMLREIRKRGIDVPAAALTALVTPEDAERSRKAGFQLHVPKPVEPAKLAAVIVELSASKGGSR